jgi:serine/threonine protein kinase
MADVYRAVDRVLHRPVAVKLLRDRAAEQAERARFEAEARILARLSHSGLVTVLDAGTDDDQPFLVMELVEGPTLASCCTGASLDPAMVASVGAQVAEALAFVHASGIVHRDVKPGNVLLGGEGRVKLADFGIARLVSDTTHHTRTGMTVGSPAYLSPEQVNGDEATAATDVYSMGLVLLEALTGRRAFHGSSMEVAIARLTTPPALPDVLPPGWRELLTTMTMLSPEGRPGAQQVAARLRALAGDSSDASATRQLRALDDTRVLPGAVVEPQQASTQHRVRTRFRPGLSGVDGRMVAVLAVLLAIVLAVTLLATLAGDGSEGGDTVPENLPAGIEPQLRELHEAVHGSPE